MTSAQSRVRWLTDLIRLEIVLWDRVDARLKEAHDLPLAHFELLHLLGDAGTGGLRIGEVAQRLRITVGGASKLVDRVEASQLIQREPDPGDRRASRVALTPRGRVVLETAIGSYATGLADVLDTVLTEADQQHLHVLVRRLLDALTAGQG